MCLDRYSLQKYILNPSPIHGIGLQSSSIVFQEFVDKNPILSEFKAEIARFQNLNDEVDEILPNIQVGAIDMNMGKL